MLAFLFHFFLIILAFSVRPHRQVTAAGDHSPDKSQRSLEEEFSRDQLKSQTEDIIRAV